MPKGPKEEDGGRRKAASGRAGGSNGGEKMNNVINPNGYIGRTAGRGTYRPGQGRTPAHGGEGMIGAICRIVRFFSDPGVKTVVAAVAVIAALVCFALYAFALLTGAMSPVVAVLLAPIIIALCGFAAKAVLKD